MGATAAVHPTDQALRSYGLGKLDDASAESVNKPLESCWECRKRVAEMSSDSFLGRLRDAKVQPGSPVSAPVVSSLAGLSMLNAGVSSTSPPPADTLPPGLADHPDYDVIRELGQGGMGTVYLAQNRLMGRYEALKVVSSHMIRRHGVLDRFQGEIRNAARLHHTNIVTAYSASRRGESIIFAMEYVEGLDLAKLVKARGTLPVANACNYAHQAALGLQHGHEQGMVHRDIKPSNLMLAKQGNRAVIKVLDFGLAKVKSEGAVDKGLTREGQMLGTPDFIAPEQIGDARLADIRADIYSLGCTLYYLLSGEPPFKATSLYEVLQAHHSMDALPLNLARPEVPVELAALVARMMAKEPARRFQAPHEVAQELKLFFKTAGEGPVRLKAALSVTRAPAVAGEMHTRSPQSARNRPDELDASQPSSALAGAGSVWDGLIDLGEPEPLTEKSAVTAGPTRPIPKASQPMVVIALSILVAATLGSMVVYMAPSTDRNGSAAPRPEDRGKAAGKRAPAAGASHERAARSTHPGSPPASAVLKNEPDHGASSFSDPSDGTGRSRQSVEDGPASDTPALSRPGNAAVTPHKPLREFDQKREAESGAPLSPDERLQRLGLKRVDRTYVLLQELDLVRRYNTARRLVEEHLARMDRKHGIEMALVRIKELKRENNRRDFHIDQRNQLLAQKPRITNVDKAEYEAIRVERDALARDRNQATLQWKDLSSQLPGQREIHELDVAIERGRAPCRSALADLRARLQSADANFEELSKNEQVGTALREIGRAKLGHKRGYENVGRQIKKWEAKVESTDGIMRPRAEPVPKKKSTTKKR